MGGRWSGQATEREDGRTGRRKDGRTGRATDRENGWTETQKDERATEQNDGRTGMRGGGGATEREDGRTGTQEDERATERKDGGRTGGRPNGRTAGRERRRTSGRPNGRTAGLYCSSNEYAFGQKDYPVCTHIFAGRYFSLLWLPSPPFRAASFSVSVSARVGMRSLLYAPRVYIHARILGLEGGYRGQVKGGVVREEEEVTPSQAEAAGWEGGGGGGGQSNVQANQIILCVRCISSCLRRPPDRRLTTCIWYPATCGPQCHGSGELFYDNRFPGTRPALPV